MARLPPGEAEAAWSASLTPGVFVGGYEIVRVAGRGGLADVHEARERATGRRVALKLFRPGPRLRALVSSEALRAEADVAARIEHPNVVGVEDAGTWAGGPFAVSEWLEGTPLIERLRDRPLPAAEVIKFSRGIAAALEAAHAAGVAHRDLEPGNVLLVPGNGVKVTGFGLARPSGKSLSAGGAPPFLAPEQWRGEPGDARTDVFALGVIMFQALTGNIPYAVAGSHTEVLQRGSTPHPVGAGIPRRLAEVVTRCLQRDPARRFRDGAELSRALAAAERGEPLRPTSRRTVAAVAGVAIVAAAAAATYLLRKTDGGARLGVVVLDEVDDSRTGTFAGISDLLVRALEPSARVRVVPRAELREAVKAAGSGRLDLPALKPAWDTLDARWALELRVRRLSRGWVGELSAASPRTGERAFTVAERFDGPPSAVDMIDRLARRARLELGEPVDEVEARPALLSVTFTPDLEAWRWFRDGEDCLAGPRAPERPCGEPFRQAVARDPLFGAAHLDLALLALEAGADPFVQRAALEPALAEGARLPPRARQVARAWRAALDGEGGALAAYGRLADADPSDRAVPLLAADLAWHGGRLADAVTWLDRALRLSPDDPAALERLARVLGHLGDRARLEALAGRLEAGARSSASLHVLSLARGWLGDAPRAAAAAEIALRAGSPLAADDAVHALAFEDDLAGAEALAREELAAAPPVRRAQRRVLLAEALAQQGRWREAQRELDLALEEATGPDAAAALRSHRVDLLAGRRDEALLRREVAALEAVASQRALPDATTLAYLGDLAGASPLALRLPPDSTAARLHAAVTTWRGGDAVAGAAALRAVVGDRRLDGGLPPEAGPFLLGSALADAGDHAAAAEALRGFQRLYEHGGWRPWALPRSRLLLAGSLNATGRRVEASEELGKLLGSLRKADPDDPLLRAARILQVQLEGRGQ